MPDFEVRNLEIESILKDLGQLLKSVIPITHGFALMISQFGEGGGTFYISDIEREGMIETMKELIKKLEGEQ